jgi:hypothetical protein
MKTSGFLQLNSKDFLKGIIVTVFAAVLTAINNALIQKTSLDWSMIGNVAITTAISYLLKNFFTNNQDQFMRTNPEL